MEMNPPPKKLSPVVQQALVWEMNMAMGFLASYEKLLSAHSFLLSIVATINFVAFLQPPKGWNESETNNDNGTPSLNTMYVMYDTGSIEAFAITNSSSLYIAISGLLFYVYCSSPSLLSSSTPLELGDTDADNVLHNVRACLRRVVLPSIRRRVTILSCFLAASLTFSVMAFISSGFAATSIHERWHYVIIPSIPGCILVLTCLVLALRKHFHDLDFDMHFDNYWKHIVEIEDGEIPPIVWLDRKTCHKLEYSPIHLPSCFSSDTHHYPGNRPHFNKPLPNAYA